MKKIVLLGASGSIGLQTIDVCAQYNDLLEIVAFSIGKNIEKCEEILKVVKCELVCVMNKHDCEYLQSKYANIRFVYGDDGLVELANLSNYDILVNALVGFAGLRPTVSAIKNKKDIALANKETLVVAGKFINELIIENNVNIFPIDSEHCAIFQALQGNKLSEVNKLIITASGGSFRNKTREELKDVTVQQALNHPNWSMGAKITIDSATMMNKGFEVIEAFWLFNIPFKNIEVIMHPQSIIHSMVEYQDNSIIAQLSNADMRLPIQYCLLYPQHINIANSEQLDFAKIGSLTFLPADFERFPLLKLAYEVGELQGNLPAYLNAANEVCNQKFLEGKIKFLDIETLVIDAVKNLPYEKDISFEDIFKYDLIAREYVTSKIQGEF